MEDEKRSAIIKGGIRSLAASIPVAGSFAQAWSEYDSYKQSQRLEELFKNLHRVFEKLNDRLQDAEKHIRKSDEFPSLLERTIHKVQKEQSENKRLRYAQALGNVLAAGTSMPFDDKTTILDTLDTLTDSDLSILGRFTPGHRIQVSQFGPDPLLTDWNENALGKEIGPLVVSLAKLESRGLISETSDVGIAFGWTGDTNHWINRWRRKNFELTPFGQQFIASIAEPK